MSSPRYITNPEALADYSEPFPEAESIKGLLVDPQKLGTSELDDLGVKHAGYNIPVSRLLGRVRTKDIRQLLIHITVRITYLMDMWCQSMIMCSVP